jgi:hypothetical protein
MRHETQVDSIGADDQPSAVISSPNARAVEFRERHVWDVGAGSRGCW